MKNIAHEKKEKVQLELFFQNTQFLSYPKDIAIPSKDPPDFILTYGNNRSSIELTELFKSSKCKYSEQELESAEKKIVTGVQKQIEKYNFLIDVEIYFGELDNPQQGYNIKQTIKDLSDLVIGKMGCVASSFEKILIRRDEKRIDGIFSVLIRSAVLYRKKGLSKTRVMMPKKPHWCGRDPFKEIQNAIQKKENGLRKYRDKYEYSYLLITTNKLNGSQAFECTEKLKNSTFDTSFSRVFLFDCLSNAGFELKKNTYFNLIKNGRLGAQRIL